MVTFPQRVNCRVPNSLLFGTVSGWEDQVTANWLFQANNKQRTSVPISPYTMLILCQRIHCCVTLWAQFCTGLRPCKIRSYTAISHLVLKSWSVIII